MRLLRPNELTFIKSMMGRSDNVSIVPARLEDVLVEEMNDGGMGSLLFSSSKGGRVLGEEVARKVFLDQDGVLAVATISHDNHGELYELDVWKTDFSKLLGFPVS